MAVENKHEIEIDDIFVKECMIYCDGFFIKKNINRPLHDLLL